MVARAEKFVYVAEGYKKNLVKIGVTTDPKKRLKALRQSGIYSFVKTWEHEAPRQIESMAHDDWRHRLAIPKEIFEATPLAAVRHVSQVIREYGDGRRVLTGYKRLKQLRSMPPTREGVWLAHYLRSKLSEFEQVIGRITLEQRGSAGFDEIRKEIRGMESEDDRTIWMVFMPGRKFIGN